ncbi:hypothetical protein I302_105565 [Kwoniella bestiolae CBS 10118]|uniref:Zn(2)-C6 fungal-type domain-containing protein n=1 Tax=Kwoniella bestiolae CBS 10118 TaxID=1296100 RepID=A0A1B9FTG4_9TREE|nr:hypothetical protein I302_08848 [Kwoniella bestiolae CBS 10118]OCF22067.1 hypothetical protein I302_08848 [Kwoniella bestiolae CBS 10118]
MTAESTSSAKISCLACRAAKRKCHTSDTHSPCRRCNSHNLTCEYTKHQRGRRKKSSLTGSANPSGKRGSLKEGRSNAEASGSGLNRSYIAADPMNEPYHNVTSRDHDMDSEAAEKLSIHFSHVIPKEGDSSPFIAGESTHYPDPSPGDNPLLLQQLQSTCPDPVKAGLLSEADAYELFNFYFDHLNVILAILDPHLHTPTYCIRHSALLFTSVLTVTAKVVRPKVYAKCMMLANKLVGQAIEFGLCSVEVVQALNLLHHWKKSDDHTSWRRIGYAIRMAQELRLDIRGARPLAKEELKARETLNRERAWFNLVIADYHLAIHHSLPRMIHTQDVADPGDWVAEHAQLQTPGESSLGPLVTFSRMCRLYADSLGAVDRESGNMRTLNWLELELKRWRGRWLEDNNQNHFAQSQISTFRLCDAYFRFHIAEYRLLFMARHGDHKNRIDLQKPNALSFAFSDCIETALGVAVVLQNDLAPYGYLSHCFYLTWVAMAVTAIWLVKNIAPMYQEDRAKVIRTLSEVQFSTEEASRSSDDMAAYTHRLLKHLLNSISPEWQLASFLTEPASQNPPMRTMPEPVPITAESITSDIANWELSSTQEIIQGCLWNQTQQYDNSHSLANMAGLSNDPSSHARSQSDPQLDRSSQRPHLPQQQPQHQHPPQQIDAAIASNLELLFPADDDEFWKHLFPSTEVGNNIASLG